MSELVEKQFPVKTLLTGLRAIGYSFSTAVADIIETAYLQEPTPLMFILIQLQLFRFSVFLMTGAA